MLSKQSELDFDDKDIAYILGTLFEAGSDTTTSALTALLLASCIDPQALQAAKEELDRVIGDERMPSLDDQSDLSHVEALWKEVQRVRIHSLIILISKMLILYLSH